MAALADWRQWESLKCRICKGAIPTPAPGYANISEQHPDNPLGLYQQVASHNAGQNEGYALFMEQGTGKTPVVINRIMNDIAANGGMYRAIIVCPNNVRLNWKNEFAKFATRQGKVTIIKGGEINRIKLLSEAMTPNRGDQYTVVVIGFDMVARAWNALGMIEWNLGVLDESHYIKSATAKRTKVAWKLRDRCAARMVLTGTPITNIVFDLYSQLEFLGRGWSGFTSFKSFKKFYGVYAKDHTGRDVLYDVQNLPFMKERLARVSFVVRKTEVLKSLKPKVYDQVEVTMGTAQADLYKQIATKLFAEIKNDLNTSQNRSLIANNILTKMLRLAQITSGFVRWDATFDDEGNEVSPSITESFKHNPKLDALVKMIREQGENSKTIVWACWVHDIKAIDTRLRDEGINAVTFYGATTEKGRVDAESDFNCDPYIKVFIGNALAGGTGLNLVGYNYMDKPTKWLPTNTDMTVYYSQNWSPTARSQSSDRNHRRTTRCQVRERDLTIPGTIDEEIRSRVLAKQLTAVEIGDVREILQNVLRGVEEIEVE